MKYNPRLHNRRTMRLKGYDYSQSGAYFVSICTHNRACLYGEIEHGQMVLNDAGRMVELAWDKLPVRFDHIELDEFTVMPNHIHSIFVLCRRDIAKYGWTHSPGIQINNHTRIYHRR